VYIYHAYKYLYTDVIPIIWQLLLPFPVVVIVVVFDRRSSAESTPRMSHWKRSTTSALSRHLCNWKQFILFANDISI